MSRTIFQFLIRYKYGVIFPIAIIEGPIITMVSGFLVSRGTLAFLPTLLIVTLGDIISDSAYYFIGRRGRKFIEKIKFLHITEERLQKIENHYAHHPRKTFILSKASYGVGSLFLVAAGAAKMGYRKFLQYIVPLNTVRSLILMLVGYSLGKAVRYSGTYIEYYTIGVIIILPLAYLIFKGYQEWKDGRSLQ